MRRRNVYEVTLALAIAVWAFVVVYCLTLPADKETPEPYRATAEPASNLCAAAPPVATESEEPVLDLARLPSIVNATMTHYCTCERCCGKSPDHPAYGITASGREAEPYTSVAVDPFVIPLGSTVYVDYGDGEIQTYRADDTGSGVNGAHIDLCVADHQEALTLGVCEVRVWWEAGDTDVR